MKNRVCKWVFFHFLYLYCQQFGRGGDLLLYLQVILCAGATNSTVINAVKRRVSPSLQAEHFASGQILSMDSSNLLYFSELQNPHSTPGLAFNPQGDPVLSQQSRALTFLFSKGHSSWSGAPPGEPPSASREVGATHSVSSVLTSRSSIVLWYHYHPWIGHSAPANITLSACITEQALMTSLRDKATESSSSAPCQLTNRQISASAPSSVCCSDRAHGT